MSNGVADHEAMDLYIGLIIIGRSIKAVEKCPNDEGWTKVKMHSAGLCGGVHSGVARRIRREMIARGATDLPTHRLVCVGDKSRTMLRRSFAKNMLLSFKEVSLQFQMNNYRPKYISKIYIKI